jgi:hypothetical protein
MLTSVPSLAGLPGPVPHAVTVGKFSASLFKFATTIPDDGEGKAGGWQSATATLHFEDARSTPPAWTRPVTVQLPIRSEKRGYISPSKAAEMSAEVATITSMALMGSRDKWIPSLFCSKFKTGMVKVFDVLYPGSGGRAT